MARAALDKSIEELSAEAALTAEDVTATERGGGKPDVAAKLRATFEVAGVEFLDETGIKLRSQAGSAQTVPLETLNSANDE